MQPRSHEHPRKPRRWPDPVAGGLGAATLAGYAGRWHWLADLASHFRWYWLVAALVWFAVAGWRRDRLSAACLGVALVGNVIPLAPYWIPADGTGAPGPTATVLVSNLLVGNPRSDAAVAFVRQSAADVVVLLEVDAAWAAALRGLDDRYPHRIVSPRDDSFGIAVLSRLPLEDAAVVEPGGGMPTIVATVRGEAAFLLVATHPLPPLSAEWSTRRDAQLAAVAEIAAASSLPVVVAGDLNATPWSAGFQALATRGRLRDTAVGRGVRGTWNARSWLVRIPIDHVLVSPGVGVAARSVGPDLGSDHLPVTAALILP